MTHVAEQVAQDAVLGDLKTAWDADPTASTIVMLQDDRKGSKPGHDADGVPLPFARASIAHVDSDRECIGKPAKYDEEAILTVQIFTPFGGARDLGNTLVDLLRTTFRGSSNVSVRYKVIGPPIRVGETPDGYYQVNFPVVYGYFQEG